MIEPNSAAGSARERILEAAEKVVAEVGAARVTLDAVAHAAGVSKGGLLYHFPSKESLLGALAKRYVAEMDECIHHAKSGIGETEHGRDLKACVLGVLQRAPGARSVSMGAALLATAANDLALLEVIRAKIAEHTRALESPDIDFARAMIVMLAVEGLMLRESLRISPFTPEQREQVVQELIKVADESYR